MSVCRTLIYIFALMLTVVISWPAYAIPGRTTYQAKIIKPNGSPLEASAVNFRFTILDPAGSCILYSENYVNVNMLSSGGLVSFSLGTGVKSFPLNATTFEQVFSNIAPSLACAAGGPASYSPLATDTRKVVVQFNDGSGWQTLPAMNINAVPYAMYANNAQTLQGMPASDFVQVSTLASCTSSQALNFNGAGFSCVNVSSSSGAGSSYTLTANDITTALGYTPSSGGSYTAVVNTVSALSSSYTLLTSSYATLAASYTSLVSDFSSLGDLAFSNSLDLGSASATGIISDARLLNQALVVSGAQYSKVTVDGKGRVISGSQITASDINSTLAVPSCGINQYLTFNGTSYSCAADSGASGTIASISATGVLSATAGSNPVLNLNYNSDFTSVGSSLSLMTTGVVPGTYVKMTVDNKGRVVSSSALTLSDITTALGYTPVSSTVLSGYVVRSQNLSDLSDFAAARNNLGLGGFATVSSLDLGSASATGLLSVARLPAFSGGDVTSVSGSNILSLANSGVTAGTYLKVSVDSKGRVISGSTLSANDVVTALGYTPAQSGVATGSQWITSGTAIYYLSGNIGIGTSDPTSNLEINPDTGQAQLRIAEHSNSSGQGAFIRLAHSRGTGTNSTIVGSGDRLGSLVFTGYDSHTYLTAARIDGNADGNAVSGSISGRLTFYTVASGATTAAERMRINNLGYVGIGTATPASELEVSGTIRADRICDRNGNYCQSISSSGTASMVSGWPDAIICNLTNPNHGLRVLHLTHAPYIVNNSYYYRIIDAGAGYDVIFNSSGAQTGYTGISASDCDSKTISQLYASGRAYNFVGGGSGGSLGTSATATSNGYLTAADWNLFNSKLSVLNLGSASATGTLAAARLPAFSGDVTSVSGSSVLTLNNSGVVSGTYTQVTVDSKGRVISGSQLTSEQISTALGFIPASYAAIVSGTGTTWQLISRSSVSVSATALSISGLDGNADQLYRVIYRVKHNNTGSTYLRFNNDAGSNYNYNIISSDSSSPNIAAGAATGLLAVGGSITVGGTSLGEQNIYAVAGDIRLAHGTLVQNNTGYAILSTGRWTNTASNITSIQLTATTANGLGAGSFIEVWAKRKPAVSEGWSENGGSLVVTDLNSNVGIGTSSPQSALDVSGTLRVSQICDRNGNNCQTISNGWSATGGSSSTEILGDYEVKALTTVYQASEDGFVIGSVTAGTNSAVRITGYADTNPTPATARVYASDSNVTSQDWPTPNSFMMPVKKNQYWRVLSAYYTGGSSTAQIYWVPLLGSVGIGTSATATTNGFLTSADWNLFNSKLSTLNLGSASATGTLAAARLPAFAGDVTSVSGSPVLTLANSGVTSGTYSQVTVDSKGRVTSGSPLTAAQIITALGFTPTGITSATAGNAVAWVTFTGTGAISSSFNVLSVSKTSTGRFTVNFRYNLPDANYAVLGTGANTGNGDGGWVSVDNYLGSGKSVSGVRIATYQHNGSFQDYTETYVAIYQGNGTAPLANGFSESGNNIYHTGNIGIGTSNPTRLLHIAGSAGSPSPGLAIEHTGANGRNFGLLATGANNNQGDGKLLFYDLTSSTTRMAIDSLGYVGVGTVSPTAQLEVSGTLRVSQICDRNGTNCHTLTNGWGSATGTGSGTGIVAGFPDAVRCTYSSNGDSVVLHLYAVYNSNNTIQYYNEGYGFTANLSTRAYVTSSGLFNGGTFNCINKTLDQLIASNQAFNYVGSGGSNFWNLFGSNISYLSGNVGIGTSNPTTALEIASSGTGYIKLYENGAMRINRSVATNVAIADFASSNGGTDQIQVSIRANGTMGIGTSSPQATLDVSGSIRVGVSSAGCSATNEGAQRYNSTSKVMEFCNGTVWGAIDGSSTQSGLVTGGCIRGSAWGTATVCGVGAGMACSAGHTARVMVYTTPGGTAVWDSAGNYAHGLCIKN